MNRKSVLISVLLALLLVGFMVANPVTSTTEEPDKSYIGKFVEGACVNTSDWKCIHLEIDLPIPW